MSFVDDRGRLDDLSTAKRRLLQARLRGKADSSRSMIRRDPARTSAPMSPVQHGMWVANEFLDNNALYSVYRVFRITGPLDSALVQRCLDVIVERHEILRTTYSGQTPPYQVINPTRPADLRFVDLTSADAERRWQDALDVARAEVRTSFDLANGPVFRTLLIATGSAQEPEHLLLFNLHHIVADDWACTVLLQEFGLLYEALAAGTLPQLPTLPVQYADFARWQHDRVSGELKESQLAYWRDALADIPRTLDLPTDHPRPAVPTHRGGKTGQVLPPKLSTAVRALAASRGVTVYTVLLTAFSEVLGRLAGQDRFAVGSLLSGRNATETEPLIGLFANTVAIPLDLSEPRDFCALLHRTHEAVLGAFEHQDITFENLVTELQSSRDAAHNPIYQVLYQCFEAADHEWDHPHLHVSPVELFDGMAKVDMMLVAVNGSEGIEVELNYALDLFTADTARRLIEVHLITLLEEVTARPDDPPTALDVLGPDLHRLVTETWSTSTDRYPCAPSYQLDETVVDLFRARASAAPQAAALHWNDAVVTYGELDVLSDRVASGLTEEGIGEPGAVVGIALPRSVELVAAVLGVLKAGGAYLPLDPGYPRARLEFVLADADAQLVITTGDDTAQVDPAGKHRVVEFDELTRSGAAVPSPPVRTDLAYVLYTSGSTGVPKGAEVTHESLTNLLLGMSEFVGASDRDRWLLLTSLAFDISTVELFLPLTVGGSVVVVPESARTDGAQQRRIIRDNKVSHVQATPSGWRLLLAGGFDEPSILAIAAGEPLSVPLARTLCARTRRLINGYGPTEATVYATFADMSSDVEVVTIGRPAANARVLLLDERMEPVLPGSVGELYIGGIGVARGYRGQARLTARRFLPDPFGPPGTRLYRTGDRARFTHTGEIELRGRIDDQVKIRGHRVEPAEVEAHLVADAEVDDAVVVAVDGPSGPRLVAYVASAVDDTNLGTRLQWRLADQVPGYLVPSAVVRLDRLPLSPNGKVDRAALPRVEHGTSGVREHRPAGTAAERLLERIWTEVLETTSVSAADNFFELGGDSVLAVHIVSRAREAGLHITPRQVLTKQTLSELAAEAEYDVDDAASAVGESPVPVGPDELKLDPTRLGLDIAEIDTVHRLTPLQAGMLYHTLRDPLEYVRQFTLEIEGAFNEVAFTTAWQRVVSRHGALRSRFLWEETAEPVQVVERGARAFDVERHDWRGVDARALSERMRALRAHERERGFDLAAAPPLRFALVRLTDERHTLVWTLHHLVFDAWSVNLVLAELFATYGPLCRGDWPAELPAAPQFGDYVEQAFRQSRGDQHWKALLESFDSPTELGLPVPSGGMEGIGHHRVVLPADLTDKMVSAARANRVTVGTVLHAAWALVLSRYSGRADVLFGTTVSGRSSGLPGVERVVGLLMNTLPVRLAVPTSVTVGEWLREVHTQLVTMRELEHCSLLDVQRHSGVPTGQRLFDTILDYTNDTPEVAGLPPGVSVVGNVESSGTGYPLVLAVTQGDELVAELEHQLGYCDPAAAERMVAHFETALRGLCDDSARLGDLGVLAREELALVMSGLDATGVPYPTHATVHGLFEEQVRRNPAAVAIRNVDGSTVSYRELNDSANRLARHLGSLGVGMGDFVGVCIEHSVELFIALFGILKAGAAYVPLDAEQPADRLGYILSDTAADVVVAMEETQAVLPASFDGRRVLLDADEVRIASFPATNPTPVVDSSALLYVMYTSGSTGRPKGVLVPHRGVVNYLWWAIEGYGVDGERGAPMLGSVAFDLSVPNFFLPLIAGKDVTLLPPDRSLDSLARLLEEPGDFSLLKITPGHLDVLRNVLSAGEVDSVRTFVVGADEVRTETVAAWRRVAPNARIINEYGPTETVVGCSIYLVPDDFDPSVPVSIGKPIANMQMYVLDDELRPMPIGVAGELYIGGDGVAHGYLGRPGLTAQRFLPDPYHPGPGARLYRTGDMARFRADGDLEFLGRNDHQVKIRGYRIELGEVEARLLSHPAVSEAVAVAWSDSERHKRLVAYVVFDDEPASSDELRRYLREALPDYMVPGILIALDAMPLSQGGKVDRSALPAPGAPRSAPSECSDEASWTAEQRTLAAIWRRVLGIDRVGLRDSFFALGGDSILSIQVLAAARREGLRITPRQMFDHQTLAELAAVAEDAVVPDTAASAHPRRVGGDAPLTPIQHWFTQLDWPQDHYNQSVRLRWSGVVDESALATALEHLVSHHEALRMRLRRNSDGHWRQVIVPEETAELLRLVDLSRIVQEERADVVCHAADEVHASLSLTDGPVVRAVLLRSGPEPGDELVISVHHLAVDTVSWMILLEDLETAYRAALAGETPVLPAKTTSVLEWAERLAEYAHSAEFRDETAYWRSARPVNTPLPVDDVEGDVTCGNAQVITAELGERDTDALLRSAGGAYRTKVPELLATALGQVLIGYAGGPIVVDVEGHGREPLFDDVDLTRTVGWFTALRPLPLDFPDVSDHRACIIAAKEAFRGVPHNGIGHGIVRFLGGQTADTPAPEVSFNYHGHLGGGADGSDPLFTRQAPVGTERSPHGSRPYLIEVIASVADGRLRIDWEFSPHRLAPTTIERLAKAVTDALRTLVEHCGSERGGVTPSDFPEIGLDQQALDRILARFDPRRVNDIYGLSPLQEGLLFHSLLDSSGADYVVQLVHGLDGDLDMVAFTRAWQHVVDRHSALRTTFAWADLPRPVQIVHRTAEVALDLLDWTDVPHAEVEARLEAHLAAARVDAFDLTAAPPQRLELIRLADGTHRFVWHSHHIILDGWSVSAVVQEVTAAYDALVEGRVPLATSAPVPYGRFIRWLAEQDPDDSRAYWRELLTDFDAATPFPANSVSTAVSGVDSAWAVVPARATERLRGLARDRRLTVGAFLHAAWALLLSRYSGTDDVLFGSTVAGRSASFPGVEEVVGLMMNTLPVRVSAQEDLDVITWVGGVQDQLGRSRDHEHCALTDIQRCGDVPPGTRLFHTILVLESFAEPGEGDGTGLDLRVIRSHEQTGYPVVMSISLHGDLQLRLNYQTECLTRDEAERVVAHYRFLIEQLIEQHDDRVGDLPSLPTDERHLLITRWNRTARSVPRDETVLSRFAEQCRAVPDRIALIAGTTSLTYGELDEAAERLAQALTSKGIGHGSLVAIHVRRSAAMVVSVLGVLKAGAAYLPLDPAYPAERIEFVLRDSAAELVLTSRGLTAPAGELVTLEIDDRGELEDGVRDIPVAARPSGDHLAYTIYTSGSTGRPKGVEVEHRSLANAVRSFGELLGCGPSDVWLALTSLPFDIAALELFLPLTTGASVAVVPDGAMRDGVAQWSLIRDHGVTHVQATPSGWALLRAAGFDAPDVVALVGGEAAPVPLLRELTGRVRDLYNVYGPTETTIWSTAARLEPGSGVTIGRPIANTQIYLLDGRLRPVAAGAPGELYIGGRGVARGYAGRAGLTAERFLPDPYGEAGARIYRTGDRARYRGDGTLEYLGRGDEQVKLRGHRIEPGEIEAHLLEHPDVAQAAVRLYQAADGSRLAAYVVPHGEQPDAVGLREHLARRVPEVMVPHAYVVLTEMPLTPNGKIDRKALPDVDAGDLPAAVERVAPRTWAERKLAEVWARVLGIGEVSVRDDFFQLGGDSIQSIRVASLARSEGLAVTPGMLVEQRTLAELAAAAAASSAPIPVAARRPLDHRLAAVWDGIGTLLRRHGVPGVGVAVIVDGEIADIRYAGEKSAGTGVAIGSDTVFQVGSVSKLVTALGAARLARAGRVDLDTDVHGYLRAWRVPTLDPGSVVTLRHLLTHTAGLSETSSGGGYAPGEAVPALVDVWFGRAPARTPAVSAQALPGRCFRYSGANYVAVEQALADVTGTPFPELLRTAALEPLGMTRSWFGSPHQSEVDVALGHDSDGLAVDGGWRIHPDLAACGLWSTPRDIARVLVDLLRAHGGRGGTVLDRTESGQLLTTTGGTGYGLGTVVRSMDSGRWFGHPGDTVGYRAYAAAELTTGSGVVVLANADGGMDLAADLVLELGLGMHVVIEEPR